MKSLKTKRMLENNFFSKTIILTSLFLSFIIAGRSAVLHTNPENATFRPTAMTKTVLEKNRIWLNFINNGGNTFSQILIGYIQTATNDYDPGFDGAYNSSSQTGLYSLIGKDYYTIQAKALPFTDTDVVPLGYTTNIQGSASISIDKVDGLFKNGQDIFIEDKLLHVVHNLKVAPYTFSTETGTYDDRFVVRYTINTVESSTLETKHFEISANDIIISSKNQQITIKCETESIDKVFIYDILGREIYQNTKVDAKNILISNLNDHEILIVKVILASGKSTTKKMAF
jgi:hypothetical protein